MTQLPKTDAPAVRQPTREQRRQIVDLLGTCYDTKAERYIGTDTDKTVADIAKAFRTELTKIMPGYKWTVHKSSNPSVIRATGVMSSGFNRLSTLEVIRDNDGPWYRAASAGHGTKAQFGQSFGGKTLARALRHLQDHYERTANTYRSLAARLDEGRRNIDAGGA